jgi:tetratricopeptide (TPR) repeat protein
LDEVLDGENRGRVVRAIDRLVSDYPSNKFVITSRIAGYQEAALGSRFREFTITPMGNKEIRKFLERWCLAIEVAQRPEAEASLQVRDAEHESLALFRSIETNSGVKRLATNPLLLTILALIHRNGTKMPQRRVELYALATKTLIEDWQFGRNIAYRAQMEELVLGEEEVMALLAPLAFRMHEEKPSGLVTQAEIESWLTPLMADIQGVTHDVALELVQRFLQKIRETTGILVERAPAVYGFMHLTFEEYFAARYIADNDVKTMSSIINSHLGNTRWEEPNILAISFFAMHSPKQLNKLIQTIFESILQTSNIFKQGWFKFFLKKTEINQKFQTVLLIPLLVILIFDSNLINMPNKIFGFCLQVFSEVKIPGNSRLKIFHGLLLLACYYSRFSGQEINELQFNFQYLPKKYLLNINSEFVDFIKERRHLASEVVKVVSRKDGLNTADLRLEALAYLREIASDRSFSDLVRIGAQRIFIDISSVGNSRLLDAEPDDDFNQLISQIPQKNVALAYFQRAENYKMSGMYAEAICDYQYSIKLYEEIGQQEYVSTQYSYLSDCYLALSEYQEALKSEYQKLDSLEKIENQASFASSYFRIGRIYQSWGKYKDAVEKYNHSRDIYEKLGDEENLAGLFYWLGDCYEDWKKYKWALESTKKYLTFYQKTDDKSRIAHACWRIGSIYRSWEKYELAIEWYEKSRTMWDTLDNKGEASNLRCSISTCYLLWGKYDEALEVQRNDLMVCRSLDDQSGVARSIFSMGNIYQNWGKYEEAIERYEQSYELYQELGQERASIHWYALGDCYEDWGEYEEALEATEKYLLYHRDLEDTSGMAHAYWRMGGIYKSWAKYESAVSAYEKSRSLWQELDDKREIFNLGDSLSDCYFHWGKYEISIEEQEHNLVIAHQLEDQSFTAVAFSRLGRIYQTCDKYSEAIVWYKKSFNFYQQIEQEMNAGELSCQISNCYLEWGKYEQAVEFEKQDLAIRQNNDDQPRVALSYLQFGRIYQGWGKYEEAIEYYQQSRDLYQQLGKEKDIANLWDWMAVCYRDWGKYEKAVESEQHNSDTHQKLDHQSRVALSFLQFGQIYQGWEKYEEAIEYYQQSRDLYQQLEKEKDVANLWSCIATCYNGWRKYEKALNAEEQNLVLRQKVGELNDLANSYCQFGLIYDSYEKYELAIEHHQKSLEIYQQLDKTQDITRQLRRIADSQRKLAQQTTDRPTALTLLTQSEQNLQQAIQLNTENEYQENLAYTQITLSLLQADRLRHYQSPTLIHQFETTYAIGLTTLLDLGQTVNHAEETLDIARAYLEIPALQNLPLAETLTHQSLQTFQTYNRRKLQAKAHQLLGQIHQANSQPEAATQALQQSRQLYQDLDLPTRVAEIDRLLSQPTSPESIE